MNRRLVLFLDPFSKLQDISITLSSLCPRQERTSVSQTGEDSLSSQCQQLQFRYNHILCCQRPDHQKKSQKQTRHELPLQMDHYLISLWHSFKLSGSRVKAACSKIQNLSYAKPIDFIDFNSTRNSTRNWSGQAKTAKNYSDLRTWSVAHLTTTLQLWTQLMMLLLIRDYEMYDYHVCSIWCQFWAWALI